MKTFTSCLFIKIKIKGDFNIMGKICYLPLQIMQLFETIFLYYVK